MAVSNLDGDLTSEVLIIDEEDLDPSKTTTQYITFEVVDSQKAPPLSLKFCSKNRLSIVVLQLMAT